MAFISKGYTESIDDLDWANITRHMGGTYSVFGDSGSFALSVGPGDREVVIAPGSAAGAGILDTSDAPVTVAGGLVSSGSRWDMVVLHREWGSVNATSVEIIDGSAVKELPERAQSPGVEDDQPLFLIRYAAGQTAVQEVVDLRVRRGDGGAVEAYDLLARSYMDRVGTTLAIGSQVWRRRLVAGVPTWVDSFTWDLLGGKPSSFPNADVTAASSSSSGVANRLVRRDSLGFFGVPTPTAAAHPTPRSYVDGMQIAPSRLTAPVPFSKGGTGAETAADALAALGVRATTLGSATLAAGAQTSFPLPVGEAATNFVVLPSSPQPDFELTYGRSGSTVTVTARNTAGGSRTGIVQVVVVRGNV